MTRCGSQFIKSSVQSYDGSVITELSYSHEGQLMLEVTVCKDESTSYRGNRVFKGTLDEFIAKLSA